MRGEGEREDKEKKKKKERKLSLLPINQSVTSASRILPPIFRRGGDRGEDESPKDSPRLTIPLLPFVEMSPGRAGRAQPSGRKNKRFSSGAKARGEEEGLPLPSFSNYAKRFYFELPRRRGTLLPASQQEKKKRRKEKRQPRNRGESFVAAEKRHEANNNPWKKICNYNWPFGNGAIAPPFFPLFFFLFSFFPLPSLATTLVSKRATREILDLTIEFSVNSKRKKKNPIVARESRLVSILKNWRERMQ